MRGEAFIRFGFGLLVVAGAGCAAGESASMPTDAGSGGSIDASVSDLAGDAAKNPIDGGADSVADVASDGGASTTQDGASAADAATDGASTTAMRRQAVCARWVGDRSDRTEGAFTGDVAQCLPGDVSAPGRANALKVLNLFRFIADMSPVTDDPTLNTQAQACSLMMDANGMLNHMPPPTWKCYSDLGASGAGTGNISPTPGVAAIELYMNDFGNDTTLGHRRWLLSNSLGPIGLGSTMKYSCAVVLGGKGHAGKPWQAWPAPGPFPFEALRSPDSNMTLDMTGWSIQSDTVDVSSATVTVTDNGQNMPVITTPLGAGYGGGTAIRWLPNGWNSTVEHTYHIQIGGVTPAIAYDVQMVACP